MIATTISQSKKLLELGLSPETADMYWDVNDTGSRSYTLHVGKNVAIERNLFSFREGMVVPCWSFSALLGVLPDYNLQRTDWGNNKTEYKIVVTMDEYNYASKNYDNPLDAAYELILKLNELNML